MGASREAWRSAVTAPAVKSLWSLFMTLRKLLHAIRVIAAKGSASRHGTKDRWSCLYRVQHIITRDLIFSYYCVSGWFPILQQCLPLPYTCLRYFSCISPTNTLLYAQPFKFQMIQMHWIYRPEVFHTLRFFLVNLLKTTIITRSSYSPNDCTVAWRHRPRIRTIKSML
jgi:hypothetical protein